MLDIKRVRMASNLLAAPASEVIGQCLDEIEALRAELSALKSAAMPVVKAWKSKKAFWHERNVSMRDWIILHSGDGTNATPEHFGELARLCGEE